MKIIIIDDDKGVIGPIKRYFEKNCFTVDEALGGKIGLDLIRKNNYDIIILDLNLPDLSGERICKIIRNEKINIPIIILSAENQINTKVNLLNIGADDYLSKPFSMPELLARINALLRRPTKITNSIFKINNLEFNRQEKTLKINNQEIYLTKKEFLILEYLINHQKMVISRNELMEHVCDAKANLFSKTIEMHMTNLRKKIDLDKEKSLIKTINGRGYMFN